MRMFLVIVVLSLFMVSCHDGCEPEETRCNGSAVEICNSDQDWEVSMDCDEIYLTEFVWACCFDLDGHYCLPADECTESEVANGEN